MLWIWTEEEKHKSNADCNTEIEKSEGEMGQQAGATTNYNSNYNSTNRCETFTFFPGILERLMTKLVLKTTFNGNVYRAHVRFMERSKILL